MTTLRATSLFETLPDQIDDLRSALPTNLSWGAAFVLGAGAFVILVWMFRRIWMRVISLAASTVFGWMVQQVSHPMFADLANYLRR